MSEGLFGIFGKSKLLIITGLVGGNPIERILETIHEPRILKKRDEIERAICGELGETDLFVIWQSLESVGHHDSRIARYEEAILRHLAGTRNPRRSL